MKKFTVYFILLIVFFSNAFSANIDFTQEEKEFIKTHPIITFSDVTWEPFSKVKNDNYEGIFREYYNLVEEKTGLKFEFKKIGDGINFEKVLKALENKKIDMIDGSGKTADREKYAIFSDAFMQVNLVIASNDENSIYNLNENSSKLTIAVARGSTAYEYIKEKSYNFKELIITNGVEEALDLVNSKKADAMVENIVVVDYLKRNKNLLNIKIETIEDYEFKIYSIVRDDYPTLVSILNKAINSISKNEILKINSLLIQKTVETKPNTIELNDSQKEYLKNKKEITMCVDPDWKPFEIINKNGEHEGIAADIIKLISKKFDLNIRLIQTKNWEESLEYSKSKKCDILSFLNETPERKKWLTFTEPIFEDPNVLVARAESPMVEDLSKIKASIALPKGTAMFERFSKDFPNLIFIPVDSENEAFSLVESKKADLTLRSLIVAAYTIKKDGLFNLRIVGKPLEYSNYLRIGVIKEEETLKDILNIAIKTITQKDIDEIVNNHVSIEVNNINYFSIGFWIFIGLLVVMALILLWNYFLRKEVNKELEKNLIQKELLFQKEKEAELGKLIANISHQWRDSLTKISYINLTTIAKLKLKQEITNDYLDKSSSEIEQSLDFMSDTMQNFLDYYKPSSNRIEFDILESIKSSISIINTKIKNHNLIINYNIKGNISIVCIRNQWMQVWINLINNSINQAIKENILNPIINITINENSIILEDNCRGFNEDILENFSKNNLNGLGLKMCRDIVSKNGWEFSIINTQKGALIKIFRTKGIEK
jgi:two-component system, NarL family, sensor histidine kinase EvgS